MTGKRPRFLRRATDHPAPAADERPGPGPAPAHQHGGVEFTIRGWHCGCVAQWDGRGALIAATGCRPDWDAALREIAP